MLYHYCERLTMADIMRDGVIRPSRQTLHKDMLGQDEGLIVGPLIWLSSNPMMDLTIVAKMRNAGWPDMLVGDLCRVVLPDGYGGDVGLGEYTEAEGIDPRWWEWVVRSGAMVGSHYTTWRIVTKEIPAEHWVATEVLTGVKGGTAWGPLS